MKSGPIVLLEDDEDDKELFLDVITELKTPNELLWFSSANDAFSYLKTTTEQPFLILSDVNIPGENGLEFKRRIDADPALRKKSIPFVYYSTAADQPTVNEVYINLTVQGFFQKSSSYEESRKHIGLIIDYWKTCKHPNSF